MIRNAAILVLAIPLFSQESKTPQLAPEAVVQRQVEAYNAHNIDQFVSYYAEGIQTLNLGSGQIYRNGIAELKKGYTALFAQFPKLKCTVVSRMVDGEFVIDKEVLEGTASPVVFATAIYQVKDGKIIKVWFL